MSAARWRRAMALLPWMALACRAAERVPVPVMPEPAPPPPQSVVVVPDWLRAFGVESWGEVVRFSPWTATLAVTFDDQEQRLTTPDSPSQRFSSRLAAESFIVRNDAVSVLDPRLFTSSLALGFLLQQERQASPDHASSENGHLLNYSFDGVFLPESAYNTRVSALRNQSTYIAPSGSTTDSVYQSGAIAFHMREDNFLRDREWLYYFTGNVRVEQQRERQTTRSAGQEYRQDDRRGIFAVDFQDGGQTSDTSFQYQYNKLDNYAYAAGSYASHSANLVHSLDFGPTLNRRWDSRINYYVRSGDADGATLKSVDVSEFLVIDHNVERSSNYSYQLNRQDTAFGVSTAQSGIAQLIQQFYANLTLDGSVLAQRASLPDGSITTTGLAGSGNYRHRLPFEGNVQVSLGLGRADTSSHVAAGLVQVVDAVYAVPEAVGAGSAILLKDRNIVAASIVVVVVKGGTRVTAALDLDYSLRIDGDRTSIVPFPASAVMQPNDPLNVSYSYEVSPDSKYRTDSRSVFVNLEWPWIGGSFTHDETDQRALAGTDTTLLLDQRRRNASLWVRGGWDYVAARASAALNRYDSTRLAYTERRLDQYVAWLVRPNLQLNLSADEYRTEYRQPDHTTTGGGVRLDLQWNQWGWLATGYLSRRVYRDTLQPHEVIDEGGFRLRRSWTLLDVLIGFGIQDRERGDSRARNGFFHFGVARRF
jgi:hypothetical protein